MSISDKARVAAQKAEVAAQKAEENSTDAALAWEAYYAWIELREEVRGVALAWKDKALARSEPRKPRRRNPGMYGE